MLESTVVFEHAIDPLHMTSQRRWRCIWRTNYKSMHNITFVNKANFVKVYNNFVLKLLIFALYVVVVPEQILLGSIWRILLRICDVSAMGSLCSLIVLTRSFRFLNEYLWETLCTSLQRLSTAWVSSFSTRQVPDIFNYHSQCNIDQAMLKAMMILLMIPLN
jgi:hypothetical protein